MATIIGDYEFTVNVDGKECILKDKIRLEKIPQYDRNELYSIKLCIKGSAKLSKFLYDLEKDILYFQNRWYGINYITIKSYSDKNNNKIFEMINNLNEIYENNQEYGNRIRLNYCAVSNRELTTGATHIKNLLEWVKRMNNKKMTILKFNKRTSECITHGFVKLELNVNKQKVFAIII